MYGVFLPSHLVVESAAFTDAILMCCMCCPACFFVIFSTCLCSITPPKPPVFEDTLTTDAPAASEEKGMSIPVIGSSEDLFQ